MLRVIEGLPPHVLGIEAIGTVTHADDRDIMIPAAGAKLAEGPSSMLYVAGPEFSGYDLQALWDDGAFGTKNWDRFERVAVVTENEGLREALAMFCPYFPTEVRLFNLADLDEAKSWVGSNH